MVANFMIIWQRVNQNSLLFFIVRVWRNGRRNGLKIRFFFNESVGSSPSIRTNYCLKKII